MHMGSSHQFIQGIVSTGAAGQGEGVGEQAEAVVAGDSQSQTGLKEDQSRCHLTAELTLSDKRGRRDGGVRVGKGGACHKSQGGAEGVFTSNAT